MAAPGTMTLFKDTAALYCVCVRVCEGGGTSYHGTTVVHPIILPKGPISFSACDQGKYTQQNEFPGSDSRMALRCYIYLVRNSQKRHDAPEYLVISKLPFSS